jgi:two-component system chemotaxis response regulator CheY
MKALIVDDSRAMRSILSRMLKGAGFTEISEAGHGKDGLGVLAAKGAVDLALVDWNMPEMNGLEFVRAVRGEDRHSAMKLMMITTESERERIESALSAGADEFLMKPFTPEMLVEKLAMMGFEDHHVVT